MLALIIKNNGRYCTATQECFTKHQTMGSSFVSCCHWKHVLWSTICFCWKMILLYHVWPVSFFIKEITTQKTWSILSSIRERTAFRPKCGLCDLKIRIIIKVTHDLDMKWPTLCLNISMLSFSNKECTCRLNSWIMRHFDEFPSPSLELRSSFSQGIVSFFFSPFLVKLCLDQSDCERNVNKLNHQC